MRRDGGNAGPGRRAGVGRRALPSARRAYCVNVVDTTGAGDIFHAGFIYGLLQGWPLERQLDFACAAAALNCTATAPAAASARSKRWRS